MKVLILLLEYLYCNYLTNPGGITPDVAMDLLALSAKFLVEQLKVYVQELLVSEFDIDLSDAATIYEFAVLHGAEKLRQHVLITICKADPSLKSLENTQSFRDIDREMQKELLSELHKLTKK